jgi:hypothetical protein
MKDNNSSIANRFVEDVSNRFVEFYARCGPGLFGGTYIGKLSPLTKEITKNYRVLPESEIPVLRMSSRFHTYRNGREIVEKTTWVGCTQILAYRFYDASGMQSEEQSNLSRVYVLGRIVDLKEIPERSDLPTREEMIDYLGNKKGLKRVVCTRTKSIETLEDLDNAFGRGGWAPVPKRTFQYFDPTRYESEIEVRKL